MLLTLCILPLFGVATICFIDKSRTILIRNFSLIWSLVVLNATFCLLFFFDPANTKFQLVSSIGWLKSLNINFILGLDGLALFFLLLTAFLIPVCVLLC